jgi:hypothetical protein
VILSPFLGLDDFVRVGIGIGGSHVHKFEKIPPVGADVFSTTTYSWCQRAFFRAENANSRRKKIFLGGFLAEKKDGPPSIFSNGGGPIVT